MLFWHGISLTDISSTGRGFLIKPYWTWCGKSVVNSWNHFSGKALSNPVGKFSYVIPSSRREITVSIDPNLLISKRRHYNHYNSVFDETIPVCEGASDISGILCKGQQGACKARADSWWQPGRPWEQSHLPDFGFWVPDSGFKGILETFHTRSSAARQSVPAPPLLALQQVWVQAPEKAVLESQGCRR